MKMIYISNGNIPSKWAHTIQTMKMAEAFAQEVDDFELVTGVHWLDRFKPTTPIWLRYGIKHQFKLTRLSMLRRRSETQVFDRGFAAVAARYSARRRPQLVHTRSPHAARLCVTNGLPCLFETHAFASGRADLAWLFAGSLPSNFLGVVTTTDVLKSEYVGMGLDADDVFVWPGAVNATDFQPSADTRALRASFGLPDDRPIVTYCGHLYQDRDIETILRAAQRLPQCLFVIVGGWPADVARYAGIAKDLGLVNVDFRGFVDHTQVPSYLAMSDILLVTYTHAIYAGASPLKLFESMAARKPIIASDIVAVRRHVVDGENGLLVEPGSDAAMVAAIMRLTSDEALCERLSARAHSAVSTRSWAQRSSAVLNFAHQQILRRTTAVRAA